MRYITFQETEGNTYLPTTLPYIRDNQRSERVKWAKEIKIWLASKSRWFVLLAKIAFNIIVCQVSLINLS